MIINNSESSGVKLTLATCGSLVLQPVASSWNLNILSSVFVIPL